nr:hypothetical protein Iba_chr03aCG15730 [Ipomoea batatas]
MATNNSQQQVQEGPPLPNIPTYPEPEPYEQQRHTLEQSQDIEQPINEQPGSAHEQSYHNDTPTADLVTQQVQNSESMSIPLSDDNNQENISSSMNSQFPFLFSHFM